MAFSVHETLIMTRSVIMTGTVGSYYSSSLSLLSASVPNGFTVEIYDGALPPGLNVQALQSNSMAMVDGTPQEQGNFRVALALKDPTGEYYSYRQYQLSMNPAQILPVNPQISYPVVYPVYIPRPFPVRLPGLNYPIHPGAFPGYAHNLHRQPPQVCAPTFPGRFGYPRQGGGFDHDRNHDNRPGPQFNPRPFPGPQGQPHPGPDRRPQPQPEHHGGGFGPQQPFPGHGGPGAGPQQPFPGHGGPGAGPQRPFPGHSGLGVGPQQPNPGRGNQGGNGSQFPRHGGPGASPPHPVPGRGNQGGSGPQFPGHGGAGSGAGPGHGGHR